MGKAGRERWFAFLDAQRHGDRLRADGSRAVDWRSLAQLAILVVFVLLNGLLMLYSIPDGPYAVGADVAVSLEPAQALLEGKGFVHPDGRPFTWGTPLYPIFLGIFVGLFPWKIALYAIVVTQCALLFSIGLMTRTLASFFSPKAATLAQILLVFNPNILITAHLLQTEILFTFLLTAALLAILRHGEAPSWSKAAVAGVLVGAATLVRPVGLFVMLLLPVLLLMVGSKPGWGTIRRSLCAGVVAIVFAGLTISPWLARNYVLLGAPVLTTNAGLYLAAQYRQLLHTGYGMAEVDTLAAGTQQEKLYFSRIGLDQHELGTLSRVEQSRILSSAYLGAIFAVPVAIHARALFESWVLLYIGGGASNIRNYLAIDSSDSIVQFDREGRSGFLDALSKFVSRVNSSYAAILLLTFGYAITARLAGIAGLARMLQKETVHATLAILMLMVVLSLSYLYVGQSRFRVPLEPYLAVMASVGILHLLHRLPHLLRKEKS